jgi:hypothetical protein
MVSKVAHETRPALRGTHAGTGVKDGATLKMTSGGVCGHLGHLLKNKDNSLF